MTDIVQRIEQKIAALPDPGNNGMHGHVTSRNDGVKVRCGGPTMCSVCAFELAQKQAAGEPTITLTLTEAKEVIELGELQRTFDLRWKADMRAIKMWQAAHPGNDLVWPDHADLVVWLLEQLDKLRQVAAAFKFDKPDVDDGGDTLEGLPDGHGFSLIWADDSEDEDEDGGGCGRCCVTAGQIRRLREVLK